MGITVEAKPVIKEWEPPYRAVIENRSGPVNYDSTFTFEETGEGVKMATHIQAQADSVFGHIPLRLVHSALTRQHNADLAALKELLESGTEVKV